MRRHLLWFVLVSFGRVARIESICEAFSCRECIINPNMCVWCSSETFDRDDRCRPSSEVSSTWCPHGEVQNQEGRVIIEESNNFSFTSDHSVQLMPQKFNLNLRVGETQTFNFSYKAVEDFPVDIYFLLDASQSMVTQRKKLQKQCQNIYSTMTRLTSDVCFGLGTFSDKNMIPFNDKPTNGTAYSFKHELDLTRDIMTFKTTLQNLAVNLGENYDNPESGLDGIAQVIACQERIKWRKQSRKILVFMTDALYHVAGDGRQAGIRKPYDGGCYLDDKGFYYKETEMDFPSVGYIRKKAADEQVVMLFVTCGLKDDKPYNELRFAVGDLFFAKSATAIKAKLQEIYEKITATVDLRVNMTSEETKHLTLTFDPNCQPGQGSKEACSVKKGEEKFFSATIRLNKYFGKKTFNIALNPKGLKESVVLKVNVITDCKCEQRAEENSTRCSIAGKWSCGVCECLKDKYGPTCSCSSNASDCRRKNETKDCSGHGVCICGSCACDHGYGGKFCQYLVDNCPRGRGLELCSGHGSCRNGRCQCARGYTGEACQCTGSKDACMKDKQECSTRGACHCGQCRCDEPAQWDARPRDELCGLTLQYNIHNRQCRRLIGCEECLHKTGDCLEFCGDRMLVMDHDIPEELTRNWKYCSNIRVDFGCYANYSYVYNDNDTITVFVLHERNCLESQIWFGMIALLVLVVVGLLTLVAWKLLTDAQDRREYNQFKKVLEAEGHAEVNVMYKDPCTTYQNPAFECHSKESIPDQS